MRRILACLGFALVLGACGDRNEPVSVVEEARQVVVANENDPVFRHRAEEAAAAAAGAASPDKAAAGPQIAYEHEVRLSVPAKALSQLLRAHQEACVAAPSGSCRIISAFNSAEPGAARGKLVLRAPGSWLGGFRAGLAGEAERAGGRILETLTLSDDLTEKIIDVEARLLAQRTLRDRLQGLLAGKPGALADLLEVERALARVQGELDAETAKLHRLRDRVATELMTLEYDSEAEAVGVQTWRPLGDAVQGAAGVVAASTGTLITLIAAALPFAVLLLPTGWLLRRALRRRRAPAAAPLDGASG